MAEAATSALRSELSAALSAAGDRLRDALRAELARTATLEEGQCLQFEIDPYFFGISSCATEEIILPGNWLDQALPADWFERAEAAEGGWNLISRELCPWFAECWQAVGGPAVYSPAYLFFHDYNREQYHLEHCRWTVAASEQ